MWPKIIIGAQWGDEGKGKVVDVFAQDADYVVRFNGGNNAGHTVVVGNERFPLSLLPSGALWQKKLLIAQGVVIAPQVLLNEIDIFQKRGLKVDLTVDRRANIVMPYHRLLDAATEETKGEKKVGSLKLGIGYCYEDRNNRHGIRLEDLVERKILKEKIFREFPLIKKRIEAVYRYSVDFSAQDIFNEYKTYGQKLKPYLGDVSKIVVGQIKKKAFLFEGAHGTFLDANFGTYPYTTAVNTIAGSVFSYVGFPPQKLEVIGVVKAYTTRVGGGPFPTELFDANGCHLQEKGNEIGTVSKRKRRCGWLDLVMLKYAHRLSGFNYLAITKLDVLSGLKNLYMAQAYHREKQKILDYPASFAVSECRPFLKKFSGWTEDIGQAKQFADLPKNCQFYLHAIEKALSLSIKYLSVGAERQSLIKL